MPSSIDQLAERVQNASNKMKDLQAMFDKANESVIAITESIKIYETQLERAGKGQARLRTKLEDPELQGEDRNKTQKAFDNITKSIDTMGTKKKDLEVLKAAFDIPVNKIGTLIAAINTINAKTTELIEKYKLLYEIRQKGFGTADTEKAMTGIIRQLEGQARAADLVITRLDKYTEKLKAAQQAGKGGLVGEAVYPTVTTGEDQTRKISEAERKRLADLEILRQKYQEEPLYARARSIAAGYEFGPETLQKTINTPVTGVSELIFKMQDPITKVNKELKMFIDSVGNVLPNTSRQFNTFASSVARDVIELTKWTIAIGLIYGPLRKFQELMGLMIENEARLASSMIVLADSTAKVADVFGIISKAADQMGEDVGGTIDVFTQAYRATGGLGDQYERINVASQLMADGMTLAKLSGMSYNEAIDHLVGSLKQTNTPLEEGRKLLDKWVKTSLVANVDVSTLAIGFSVLGESALAAGMSVDQLNGLLAIIAENMGTSGAEAANAARAIVSGFESSKAIKAMNLLGISVTNLEGETRPLLDIMTQIQNMRLQGLISESQFSKLTLAIGGGTRRQAVVAATIEDTAKINQVAAESADSVGAAEEALGKKLDTVQTAVTRLNNAFQSLAETLGDSGGLLDLFKLVLEITTGIVKAVDSLAAAIGKTAPLLGASLLAKFLFSKRPDLLASVLGGIGGFANKFLGNVPSTVASAAGSVTDVRNADYGETAPIGRGTAWAFDTLRGTPFMAGRAGVYKDTTRQNLGGLTAGVLMSLYPVISNLSSGKPKEAAAAAAGSIVGGILGNLTGPGGALIGSVIGQAIAEAFVKNTEMSLNIPAFKFAEPPEGGTKTGAKTEEEIKKELVSILYEGYDEMAGMLFEKPIRMMQVKLATAFANIFFPSRGVTEESAIYALAPEEKRRKYEQRLADLRAQGRIAEEEGVPSYFEKLQKTTFAQAGPMVTTMRKAREIETGEELNIGKINTTEFVNRMTQLKNFETVAAGWETALGELFRQQNKDIKTVTDSYKIYLDIMTYGSAEQIGSINTVTSSIETLMNQIDTLEKLPPMELTTKIDVITGEEIQIPVSLRIQELKKELDDVSKYAVQVLSGISVSTQIEKYPIPNLFNKDQVITGGLEQLREFLLTAGAMNEQYIKQSTRSKERPLGATEEEITTIRAGYEDVAFAIEEGGKVVYYSLLKVAEMLGVPAEKIDSEWLQKAWDAWVAAGKLTVKVDVEEPGLQETEVPMSMQPALESWVKYFQDMLRSYGMRIEEGPQVVIWGDEQWSIVKADQRALQMALAKIQETEQKQLEQGIWNIPEGATVWVPITSLTPANQPQGGGGGWEVEAPPAEKLGPFGTEGQLFGEQIGTMASPAYVYVVNQTEGEKLATSLGSVWQGHGEVPRMDKGAKFTQKNITPIGISAKELDKEPPKTAFGRWWEELLSSFTEMFKYKFPKKEEIFPKIFTEEGQVKKPKLPDWLFNPDLGPTWNQGGFKQGNQKLEVVEREDRNISPFAGIENVSKDAQLQTLLTNLNNTFRGLSLGMTGYRTSGVFSTKTDTMPTIPKMSLNLNNTMTLVVDGRTLATVIKPYLIADLTRAITVLGRSVPTYM